MLVRTVAESKLVGSWLVSLLYSLLQREIEREIERVPAN